MISSVLQKILFRLLRENIDENTNLYSQTSTWKQLHEYFDSCTQNIQLFMLFCNVIYFQLDPLILWNLFCPNPLSLNEMLSCDESKMKIFGTCRGFFMYPPLSLDLFCTREWRDLRWESLTG